MYKATNLTFSNMYSNKSEYFNKYNFLKVMYLL